MTCMENELRARRDALEFLWAKGLSGKNLLMQHTDLIDAYLAHSFRNTEEAQTGMTLVALGGYGRKELFPYSDIDLMLLYDPAAEKHVSQVAENIFYPLWDAGLEVGHAVRSPEECLSHGLEDFYFQVAMLDARVVVGSEELFEKTRRLFSKSFVEGKRRDFFLQMQDQLEKRHQHFGTHIYQLEPNIKECLGGLRDVQAMLWTAQVVFGLHDLTMLEDAGLLTEFERLSFEKAWNFLVKVRNRLHYFSKRKNDRLYFEHQEEMANALSFKTKKEMLGVEQFMQQIYHHMNTIAVTTGHFFEHVDEVLNLKNTPAKEKELEPGLVVKHGRIQLLDPKQLVHKPELLIRTFVHAARLGAPIHYRTKRIVTENLHLIDDKLRSSKTFSKSFLEILQSTETPFGVLSSMLDTGLMNAYIPEFATVSSLAQHDVYHTYTVDRHLLQTLAELKYIRHEELNIYSKLSAPHILSLAALLHDIGKGQGGNHSALGAEMAGQIGKRLGLQAAEISDLVFLIQNHLFLVHTALRRDLDDEAFIIRCARKINSIERLHMLYLLSIADARATGEEAWSKWKAALLLELYLKIIHLLDHAELVDPDRTEAAVWMRNQIKQQLGEGQQAALIDALPEEYILNSTPENVISHILFARDLDREGIILKPEDHGHYWSILIMAPDSIGLLSKVCGAFALHNLDVVAAQIFTWDNGIAVDMLNVHSNIGIPYEEQDWPALERDLKLALANRLGLVHRLVGKSQMARLGAKQPGLTPEAQVFINNTISERYTVMEIFADDHTALLFDITRTLAEFSINIARAKIGTKGDQVVDVFYVLDQDGRKIEDEMLQEEITRALLHVADKDSGAGRKHHLR